MESLWQKIEWAQKNLLPFLARVFVGLLACLAWTMLLTSEGGIFAWLLGANNKKETIEFIAFGMGGVLAVIGAVAINRRADAQVAAADAQVRNNELVEIGHIEERFKSATESLGHRAARVRIAAFYQFYYLAKDNPNADFRKNIFDILCAHLRDLTRQKSYRESAGKTHPAEECQTLLNILFKAEDKTVFAGLRADLQHTYIVGANLQYAHMQGANFSFAILDGTDFRGAKLGTPHLCDVKSVKNTIFVATETDRTSPLSRIPKHKADECRNDWDD